jgi:4'-phosphopantetheinyl transferase
MRYAIPTEFTRWSDSVHPPPLPDGSVHVWRVELGRLSPRESEFLPHLSQAETTRAARFIFQADRSRYVSTHGALRAVLGQYLGRRPGEIILEQGEYGKPFVSKSINPKGITFNLSHSEDLCLIALAQSRALGIDIEKLRDIVDCMELAAKYFSEEEKQSLLALPTSERPLAFFCTWTRKEAYVKATGRGLDIPLDEFSVSTALEASPILHSQDACRWELRSLLPARDFVGALVAERPLEALSFWDFL